MNKYILNGMDNPPPPPPPPTTPAPAAAAPAAKSRKMLYAIILIVIIVVVGVVAAVMLMKPGGTTGPLSAEQLQNAHSIQFSASFTMSGQSYSFTYYAKNLGTTNMMMRMVGTVAGMDTEVIVNGVQHKAWAKAMGEWVDMSDYFDTQWSALSESWSSINGGLGDWNGQSDYTYTDPSGGYSVHVYDIRINPDLADSMFVH
jgi:hypothetical protein